MGFGRFLLPILGFLLFGCGGAQQTVSFVSDEPTVNEKQPPQKQAPPFLKEEFDPQRWTARELTVTREGNERAQRSHLAIFLRAGEAHLWWFPAVPGGTYQVILTSVTGDADLFVYYPESFTFFLGIGLVPWLGSTNPIGFQDTLIFQTGLLYPFWVGPFQQRFVVVFGALPSTYRLTVWQIG